MLYYIILLAVISLFAWIEYDTKKSDYKQAKLLNEQFDEWIKSDATSQKPSNAIFAELYKKRYGKEVHPQNIVQHNGYVISTNQVDVVGSFPNRNRQILAPQIILLNNLEAYYEAEYYKIKSVKAMTLYIISLPLQLLKYIGIDDAKTSSRLFQLLIWIIGLFLPPLKELLISFLKFLMSSK
ncbi:hypothetical protein HCC45_04930 [Streptococcus suis]|nr:hypothetical protein [Streptococcus suis]